MTLSEQAIEEAGLSDIAKRRVTGEALSPEELSRAASSDLLALGALADLVRHADMGDEVRVFADRAPSQSETRVVVKGDGDRGSPLFRRIALARLAAKKGTSICLDFSDVGLEVAQVALSFGVSELAGPLGSKKGLPLAEEAKKSLAKKSELAGYITRAKRTAVFVDETRENTRSR